MVPEMTGTTMTARLNQRPRIDRVETRVEYPDSVRPSSR
jgi:hypothetical protein